MEEEKDSEGQRKLKTIHKFGSERAILALSGVQKPCLWLDVSVWIRPHVLAPVCQNMNRSWLQSRAAHFLNVLSWNRGCPKINQYVVEAWLSHANAREEREVLE